MRRPQTFAILEARGRSSMVERQLPKLHTRVRFPSPAPILGRVPGEVFTSIFTASVRCLDYFVVTFSNVALLEGDHFAKVIFEDHVDSLGVKGSCRGRD